MKGFKGFDKDMKCRGFQYEVGKIYEHDGKLSVCNNGFHFCEKAVDCFNYYSFNSNNKVAEIIAHGDVVTDGDKSCTNKIEIVREVAWSEVLEIVNMGKNNTGHSNTGDSNTGNSNTGDRNTGDRNTGYGNTGDYNATNYSSGCFCTEEPKLRFFDEESDMTIQEWRNSDTYCFLPYALTMDWFAKLTKANKKILETIPNYTEEKMIALIKKMEEARKI